MNRDANNAAMIDDRQDSRLPRAKTLLPRTPKSFKVEKAGTGVRVSVVDWGPESVEVVGSAAISYLVYWAETVDTTTDAGVQGGFARATLLSPPIPSPGKADGEATGYFADPLYLTGYFYCVGVDAKGNRSAALAPVQIKSGTGGTVPPDVEHFAASESGEQHDLTTISAVSYSFRIPIDGASIDRVQFNYTNYPNLNQRSEGESVRITAAPGGTQTGKLQLPIGRRIGSGTISIAGTAVTGVGTNFLSLAAAAGGDQIEVFGFRARIASVTSNTVMTLSVAWPAANPAVAAAADWQVIASVTIYAVSLGVTGARRDDVENAPSVTVDLDGDLSTPNAPSLTAVTVGNIIRVEIAPPAGTQLARIVLYRATGVVTPFDKTTFSVIHAFEIDNSNSAAKSFQWDDSDFTVYQREQTQVFSYFATAVNVRDQESAASARVAYPASNQTEAACRLDSPADGGGTMPARFVAASLTWNNMFSGTAAGSVGGAVLTDQDLGMGYALPAGFHRWNGTVTGTGSTPGFQNTTEVILGIVGAGTTGSSILTQDISAWDSANSRIPKGKMVTFQFKAYHTAGTVNGVLSLQVSHFNAGLLTGLAHLKTRDAATDAILFTTTTLTINGSDLPASPTLYWGAFLLLTNVPTDTIQVGLAYQTTNYSGVNIVITEPMLSLGDGLPYWSPWVDPNTIYSAPGAGATLPPGRFVDRDGSSRDIITLP